LTMLKGKQYKTTEQQELRGTMSHHH